MQQLNIVQGGRGQLKDSEETETATESCRLKDILEARQMVTTEIQMTINLVGQCKSLSSTVHLYSCVPDRINLDLDLDSAGVKKCPWLPQL